MAVLARSPHLGGKVLSVNEAAARQVPGVQAVVVLPDAVAVVAQHTWAALKGRNALQVQWSPPGDFSSAGELARLQQALDDPSHARVLLRQQGTTPAAPSATGYSARFVAPSLKHVLPEPLNATARATHLGLGVEISGSTQSPDLDMRFAAKTWKTAPMLVTHQVVPSGGAYGRRVLNDAVQDACLVAKPLGQAVQVIRPMLDELRRGQVRPAALQRIHAELDAQGMLKHWHHELASDGTLASQLPTSLKGPNGDDDNTATDGTDHPYRVPHAHIAWARVASEPAPGFLRGVAAAYTVWAIESTVERLAMSAGQDPLQWRLRHLDDPRLAQTLQKAAQMARWGAPDRHLGIGLMAFRGSKIACVAEVKGQRVAGLWLAADVGQVVHRGQVHSQIEGGAIWGLSMALWEQLVHADGAAQIDSLAQYRLPTVADLPPIHIHLMEPEPGAAPCGVGEVGVPTVIPAICNAFERATGRRFDRLPLDLTASRG
jgi:isoquinoline 1-oxidoreductase beta subunit